MKILLQIFRYLFVCKHKNIGFPVRNKRVCLDCGLERRYDFENSKFVGNWKRYA